VCAEGSGAEVDHSEKGLLLCGLLEGEGGNERERKKIKKMKRKIKYNKI
jgi:hypothetical protein